MKTHPQSESLIFLGDRYIERCGGEKSYLKCRIHASSNTEQNLLMLSFKNHSL